MAKSNSNAVVPEAREALDKFKMEAASDFAVPDTNDQIMEKRPSLQAVESKPQVQHYIWLTQPVPELQQMVAVQASIRPAPKRVLA